MRTLIPCGSTPQNIAIPLGYDSKDTAPVKRFAAQLAKLGAKVRLHSALAFGNDVA